MNTIAWLLVAAGVGYVAGFKHGFNAVKWAAVKVRNSVFPKDK